MLRRMPRDARTFRYRNGVMFPPNRLKDYYNSVKIPKLLRPVKPRSWFDMVFFIFHFLTCPSLFISHDVFSLSFLPLRVILTKPSSSATPQIS